MSDEKERAPEFSSSWNEMAGMAFEDGGKEFDKIDEALSRLEGGIGYISEPERPTEPRGDDGETLVGRCC
jgi:hypothetical protein